MLFFFPEEGLPLLNDERKYAVSVMFILRAIPKTFGLS